MDRPTPPDDSADGAIAVSSTSDAAQATTGRSVLRGGAWNVGTQLLNQFYSIATSVVAARFLGVAGLGRLTYIAFVQTTVALILTAGLPQAVMRYVSEALGRGDSGEVRQLQRWAWRVASVGAVIGTASLAAIGFAGAAPRAAWILAGVGAGAAILHHIPSALLIGAQRWRSFTSISVVTGTAGMAAKIAVLYAGGRITSIFAVDAAGACINLAAAQYLARRTMNELPPSAQRSRALIRPVLRFAGVSSITILLTFVVWRRTELFFLQKYATDAQIALYSIPFSAVAALLLVPTALAIVASPAFATLFGASAMDRLQSGYGRAVRVTTVFTFPVTAVALALGPTLLKLVYGNQFAGTRDVLRILLVTFPLIPMMDISNALLLGLGRRWPQVIIGVVAAGANIAFDLLLIPRHGAVGAALANSCAQLVGAVPIIVYANWAVGWTKWHPSSLGRSAVAAAASGGAAVVVLSLFSEVPGVLLGFVAFCVSFGVLAWALGVLAPDDGRWLDETIGHALGGFVGKGIHFATARPSRLSGRA
jgi:O-antigen/teichoic acid export membrane protein